MANISARLQFSDSRQAAAAKWRSQFPRQRRWRRSDDPRFRRESGRGEAQRGNTGPTDRRCHRPCRLKRRRRRQHRYRRARARHRSDRHVPTTGHASPGSSVVATFADSLATAKTTSVPSELRLRRQLQSPLQWQPRCPRERPRHCHQSRQLQHRRQRRHRRQRARLRSHR